MRTLLPAWEISVFLSQSETGQRAGYQRRPRQSRRQRDADDRAGGDFLPIFAFLGIHGVPQEDGSLLALSNAALVWVPLLVIATFAARVGMNDIASSKASIREQLPVLKRPHMWLLSLLYLATFGSFIGFSAGFAMLAKTQFPDVNILKLAFFGPFIGALARSFGGIISDRLGGVRVTLVNFVLMALFTGLLFLTLPAAAQAVFSSLRGVYGAVPDRRSRQRFHLPDDRRDLSPNHPRQREETRRQRRTGPARSGNRHRGGARLYLRHRRDWWLLYPESLRYLAGDDRLPGRGDEGLLVFYVVCVLVTGWSTAVVNRQNNNGIFIGWRLTPYPAWDRTVFSGRTLSEQEEGHE